MATADSVKGTATLLGTEDVNVTTLGAHTVRHNGFNAELIRTAVGWRLNSFNATPLNN